MNKKLTSILTSALLLFSAVLPAAAVQEDDRSVPVRQMEYLDRGAVAVRVSGGVYLSWRLLGTENYNTAFDVYRGNSRIATVADSTNYTDYDGTNESTYTVVPAGAERSQGKTVSVWQEQYITIPLEVPAGGTSREGWEYTYSPNDAACADVDGDGEYEIILKWDPSNSFDSGDAKHNDTSGNVYIDAYKLDGTKLWRIDLGVNIPAGAHFTQLAAYDFDLDGKAELAIKTAPGSRDGLGRYVSEASSIEAIRNTDNSRDYRNQSGRALDGDEYYTVFQGDTGEALDTVYYPHPRGTIDEWGDGWGNKSERYLAAVAYLDGIHPAMVTWRGYYDKTTAAAYHLTDKKLVQIADFNTDVYQGAFSDKRLTGNGNHNLTVADVDNDGRDEILCGAIALEYWKDDFSVLWCSEKGHGDALHLGDYDPEHQGMEYFSVQESAPYGMTLYDAASGNTLFHQDAGGDTGRGMMANVGYGNGYFDLWGAGVFTSYGQKDVQAAGFQPDSTNFRIFWDENTYDELLDGTGYENTQFKISGKKGRIASLRNCATINSSKNNPCLQADLFGDWREEIVARTGEGENQSLLIYTTTIPTEHKLYTLMHDSAYRMQVAAQNVGYNQPPHISYFINEEKDEKDMREYAAYIKTVYNGVTAVRTENIVKPSGEPEDASVLYTQNLLSVPSGGLNSRADTVEEIPDCSVADFGSGTNRIKPYAALDGWGYMHYGYKGALTRSRQTTAVVEGTSNTIYVQGVGNSGCNGAVSFIPANRDGLRMPAKGALVYEFDTVVEVTGGNKGGSPKLGFTSAADGSTVSSAGEITLEAAVGEVKTYQTVMEYNLDNHTYTITVDGEKKAEGSSDHITGIYAQAIDQYIRIGIANMRLTATNPIEPSENYPYSILSHSVAENQINYTIYHNGEGGQAKLMVCAYDENNMPVQIKMKELAPAGKGSFETGIDGFGKVQGVIKAFIWDGMNPLCEVYEVSP